MNITNIIATSVLAAMLITAPIAHAQIGPGEVPQFYLEGQVGEQQANISNWVDLLVTAVRWFYTILFIIAVLYILIAAFTFITSGGDSEKVKKAKNMLLFAVVGIAVAFISYSFIPLVQNVLSGT